MKIERSTLDFRKKNRPYKTLSLLWLLPLLSSCQILLPSEAQPAGGAGGGRPERDSDGPVAVQTVRVKTGALASGLAYTGTSRPVQQVALRSQIDGEVVALSVESGDSARQGDLLVELDGDLQTIAVGEADAELAARRAELAEAAVSVTDAQAAVVQAKATFEQAKVDAQRLRQLAAQGGISQQEAEAAELLAVNAQQAVRSAAAQVEARRQAADAVESRVDAQQATVSQTQKQLSYAEVRSPLAGTVLSRQVDVGDYVESGTTLLELGDLSTLEVVVQVSDRDLAQIALGQRAQVAFDALPAAGETTGRITQITPAADLTSRLVPVVVTLPNPNNRVGSGLLARVRFLAAQGAQVIVPAGALGLGGDESTVFVVEGEGEQAAAVGRAVRVGDREGDRVEILSGLSADDALIVESDRPLTSGQAVRLSILSETLEESSEKSSEDLSEDFGEPSENSQETP